ncbi:monooxygenase [Azospirillum sp. TSH7]|uniref:FAD-dependent monooxygenase n=1 Tax=unclassified Azospirillum TaxID=2630922 RepID=UPI000D61E8C0|nr:MULTISPECIES: FAD-dependent monooxygenase [unclassified Azospirillum]PWC63061.1 monooxygenase [Azospirillum sp. TSH7]PWC72703.1 monooxygenase [Azospirillum sp. TSH20]
MKITIIGGGPAGLYFALLAKKHDPAHDIQIFEQNPRGATYGWGVVFSDVGLSFLKEADPDFFAEFTAGHECCDYMEIVHRDTRVQIQGNHFSRTARLAMLETLEHACRRVGVEIRHGERITDIDALARDADLLVGADGANSAVRLYYAEQFRPSFERRRNKFAWYGTRQRFHPVSLIFRETAAGVFIAHSYQYSPEFSTFLVEVAPETWLRAGFDRMSEEESSRACAEIFRADLGSNPLLTNRSHWFEANVVRNEHWHHGNVVLLGDALRTVHFSLGSGTRMAMQDAIALHRGIVDHPDDLPAAFAAFEAQRRRSSSSFQGAAARSLDWYETVAGKLHLDPVDFAYDYMRRTGQVSHEDLRRRDPYFTAAYEAQNNDEPLGRTA